ncbi:hypothetical protein ACWEGV_26100, partial [Streptomyces sp. NPDC004976]
MLIRRSVTAVALLVLTLTACGTQRGGVRAAPPESPPPPTRPPPATRGPPATRAPALWAAAAGAP